MNDFNLGQFLINPEPTVTAARLWMEANAWKIGAGAVASLVAAGTIRFAADAAITSWKERRAHNKRWSNRMKLAKKAGLLKNPKLEYSGIPIGKLDGAYLCWVDQEPVLVTGGTRSGKGVGVIRPACLTYGGPLIAYDGGKGELFRDTSGYRSRFSHVLKFDLTDVNGAHFNFLDEIDTADPVAGADNLAESIPRPEKSNEHFEAEAEKLIAAVILHVLHGEEPENRHMAYVCDLINRGDEGMRHIVAAKAHPKAVLRVNSFFAGDAFGEHADDAVKYRQNVYSSASVRLKVFDSPVVAKITSRSDFRLRDLFRAAPDGRPVSLYLTTPASEDRRVKPVISMFLSMLLDCIMKDQPALEGERRTLLVVDEFASLRMNILQTAITKIVGAGCTMLFGAQSLNALSQDPYGVFNQFRDNIRCTITYAANDTRSQNEISQASGKFDDVRASQSKGSVTGKWQTSRTETESEAEKNRIDAGEVRELEDEVELIFITGKKVIRAEKIRDFEDPILSLRLGHPKAPTRAADGVYPDLPHPDRKSPWSQPAVSAAPSEPIQDEGASDEPEMPPIEEEKPKRKPRAKRKLLVGEF